MLVSRDAEIIITTSNSQALPRGDFVFIVVVVYFLPCETLC